MHEEVTTRGKLPSSREAEQTVLAGMLVGARRDLLAKLDRHHFVHCSWLFGEIRRMVEDGGFPLDGHAFSLWFCSEHAKDRAAQEGIDNLPGYMAEVLLRWVGNSHTDFAVKILDRKRALRGVVVLARRAEELLLSNPEDPLVIVEELQTAFDAVRDFVYARPHLLKAEEIAL